MGKFQKNKTLSLSQQIFVISEKYKNVKNWHIRRNTLVVVLKIKPTEYSSEYIIEIKYKKGYKPTVWLLEPKLQEFDGKKPHHIYGFCGDKVRLCIYDARDSSCEWNSGMVLADTVIPWVSTWLFAYEYWLITGIWHYDEIVGDKKDESNDKKAD